MFDLKTLKATGKIKASGVPDAILYDPVSKRVITFNHGTNDGTLIDPSSEKVGGHDRLRGQPEAAVADGKGHIFVNIAQFERDRRVRTAHAESAQPLVARPRNQAERPGHRPKNRHLFSGCNGNSKMVVMDRQRDRTRHGRHGRGSDGCGFDPSKGFAYSANGGDGTVTVIGEGEPGKFKVVATIPTQASARTMTLDPKTHRLYLSAATPVPAPAGAQTKRGRRGSVPGSFVIVVVGE